MLEAKAKDQGHKAQVLSKKKKKKVFTKIFQAISKKKKKKKKKKVFTKIFQAISKKKKKKKKRSSQKFFRRSQKKKKKKKKKVFTKIFQAISKKKKKKKKRSSQKFFKRSPRKNAFQKIFQPLHKILTFQKIVLSSSRGQANFRGLEASRPRPRTSKSVLEDVLEAKDVLEDSTSACYYFIENFRASE